MGQSSGVQRRPLQGVVNGIARALLRIPLLSRLVGRGLIILYVVGRRSGKRYTVPIAYLRHEDSLLLGSGFAWGQEPPHRGRVGFARFNHIGSTADGDPDPDDLHAAWANGARVFLLALR